MKRIITTFLLVVFSFSSYLLIASEKQDLWVKAISEKNLETRLNYLEQFSEKYNNDKRFFKNLYINLTKTAFQLRNFDKTIKYGEMAITAENLEVNYKLELYLYIANAYNVTKSDIDKAFQYAGMVIEIAESMKKGFKEDSKVIDRINKSFEAPSLRIQASILYSKSADDPENMKKALEKVIQAYRIDKTAKSAAKVFAFAFALYKKNKTKIDDSISAVEELLKNPELDNTRFINVLSHWYLVKKDKENAIKYLKLAYEKGKKGSIALKLGQLLYKSSPEAALGYFAESYLLSGSDKESNAYKYLQQLWFNQVAKEKSREEQDSGFTQILEAAKSRIEKKDETSEENSENTEENI